jgi:hypothetical protein
MDSLSKAKKDEYATSFAILALYDGGADVTSEQITALLEATGNTEVEAFYPIIYANFLSDPAKIGEMIAAPGGGGGTSSIYLRCVQFAVESLDYRSFSLVLFCLFLVFQVAAAVAVPEEKVLPQKRKRRKKKRRRKKPRLLLAEAVSLETTPRAVIIRRY